MKRYVLILALILGAMPLRSQHFSYTRVDFKKVRSEVAKKKSAFFYPVLFERYRNNDTALNHEEFRYLYYGYTFQEDYRPYAIHDSETQVNDLLMKDTLTTEDFSVIQGCCREILKLHPFSIHYLLTAAIASSRVGDTEEAGIYYFKYNGILSAILSSGDGATEQSAWSVILISDEAELIRAMGFIPTGKQKMISKSRCDFIYIAASEYAVEGFYFDVSQPFSKGFQ
jgi:hypothetical protein